MPGAVGRIGSGAGEEVGVSVGVGAGSGEGEEAGVGEGAGEGERVGVGAVGVVGVGSGWPRGVKVSSKVPLAWSAS